MPPETTFCEYRQCGGVRGRETSRRWLAHFLVRVGKRDWLVCESCVDFLMAEARDDGYEVSKELLPEQ